MNRQFYFNYIEERLATLEIRIRNRGTLNILDLNIHSETFFAQLIMTVLGFHFDNLNTIKQNIEGIDLIDNDNKIIAQVSATSTKAKIESSLSKKTIGNYPGYRFAFIVISGDASNLRKKNYNNPYNIDFDPANDIYDIKRLLSNIKDLDIDSLKSVYELIQKELGVYSNNENNVSHKSVRNYYFSLHQRISNLASIQNSKLLVVIIAIFLTLQLINNFYVEYQLELDYASYFHSDIDYVMYRLIIRDVMGILFIATVSLLFNKIQMLGFLKHKSILYYGFLLIHLPYIYKNFSRYYTMRVSRIAAYILLGYIIYISSIYSRRFVKQTFSILQCTFFTVLFLFLANVSLKIIFLFLILGLSAAEMTVNKRVKRIVHYIAFVYLIIVATIVIVYLIDSSILPDFLKYGLRLERIEYWIHASSYKVYELPMEIRYISEVLKNISFLGDASLCSTLPGSLVYNAMFAVILDLYGILGGLLILLGYAIICFSLFYYYKKAFSLRWWRYGMILRLFFIQLVLTIGLAVLSSFNLIPFIRVDLPFLGSSYRNVLYLTETAIAFNIIFAIDVKRSN